MANHKQPDLSIFAEAGGFAGRAFATFYQDFVDGVAYQLGQSEPNDVPVKGIAKCTNEVVARAFIAFYQTIIDAFDQYGIPKEPPADGEGKEHCLACWCNSCAKLEDCTAFPASDGITPPPCAECGENEIIMPVGAHPECGEYEPSAEALENGKAIEPESGDLIRVSCLACWCRDCRNWDDCVVEKAGFDASTKPCPCDGCEGAERYMPREKPPTCGKYIARAVE